MRAARESKLRALYGPRYGAVLISEVGSRAKTREERREALGKELQEGTLPAYGRALEEVGRMRSHSYTADLPMHANAMRRAASTMYPYLGPATAPVLEFGGLANEVMDWGRGLLRGGQQTGFDPTDLVANRLGIMEGIRQVRGGRSYQKGSLPEIIKQALTAPDVGPVRPDLTKYGPGAASVFPLTVGSLAYAKLRGYPTTETPEGAYAIQGEPPSASSADGQTLGEAMFLNPETPEAVKGGARTHELGHVAQNRQMGLLFPLLNVADQLRAVLSGSPPEEARFERAATSRGQQLQRVDPQMLRALSGR